MRIPGLLLLLLPLAQGFEILTEDEIPVHSNGHLFIKSSILFSCNQNSAAATPLEFRLQNGQTVFANVTCLPPRHEYDDILVGYVPRAVYPIRISQCAHMETGPNSSQALEQVIIRAQRIYEAQQAWEASQGGVTTVARRRLLSIEETEDAVRRFVHAMGRQLLSVSETGITNIMNNKGSSNDQQSSLNQTYIQQTAQNKHTDSLLSDPEYANQQIRQAGDNLATKFEHYADIGMAVGILSNVLSMGKSFGVGLILGAVQGYFQGEANHMIAQFMRSMSTTIGDIVQWQGHVEQWIGNQQRFDGNVIKEFHNIDGRIDTVNQRVTNNYNLIQTNGENIVKLAHFDDELLHETVQNFSEVRGQINNDANLLLNATGRNAKGIMDNHHNIVLLFRNMQRVDNKIRAMLVEQYNRERDIWMRRALIQAYYAHRDFEFPLESYPFVVEDGVRPLPYADRLALRSLQNAYIISEVRIQFSTDAGSHPSSVHEAYDVKIQLKCDPEYYLNNTIPHGMSIMDFVQLLGPVYQNGTQSCWEADPSTAWTCHCVIDVTHDTCESAGNNIWPFDFVDTSTVQTDHDNAMVLANASALGCAGDITTGRPQGITEPFVSHAQLTDFLAGLCQGTYNGGELVRTAQVTTPGHGTIGDRFRIVGLPGNSFVNLVGADGLCSTTLPQHYLGQDNSSSMLFNVMQALDMAYHVNLALNLTSKEVDYFGAMPSHVRYRKEPFAKVPSMAHSATCTSASFLMTSEEKLEVRMLMPRSQTDRVLVEFDDGTSIVTNQMASGLVPGTAPGTATNFSISSNLVQREVHDNLLPARAAYFIGGFPLEGDAAFLSDPHNYRVYDVPRELMSGAPPGTQFGKVTYVMENAGWPGVSPTSHLNLTQWLMVNGIDINPDAQQVGAADFTRNISATYRTDLSDGGVWDMRCAQYMDPRSSGVNTPLTNPLNHDNNRCMLLRYYAMFRSATQTNTTVAMPYEFQYTSRIEFPLGQAILNENSGCPTNYSVRRTGNQFEVTLESSGPTVRTALLVESGCATSSTSVSFSEASPSITYYTACGNDHDLQVFATTGTHPNSNQCFANPGIPLNADYTAPGSAGVRASTYEYVQFTSDRDIANIVELTRAVNRLNRHLAGMGDMVSHATGGEQAAQLASDRAELEAARQRFTPQDNRTQQLINGYENISTTEQAALDAAAIRNTALQRALQALDAESANITHTLLQTWLYGENLSKIIDRDGERTVQDTISSLQEAGKTAGFGDIWDDLKKLINAIPDIIPDGGGFCSIPIISSFCNIFQTILNIIIIIAVVWILVELRLPCKLMKSCKKKKAQANGETVTPDGDDDDGSITNTAGGMSIPETDRESLLPSNDDDEPELDLSSLMDHEQQRRGFVY